MTMPWQFSTGYIPLRVTTFHLLLQIEHSLTVLNIGSIRIYILMTGVVSNETNTYVCMYIEEFILVDLDTLLHKVEVLNEWSHWEECCLIYTRNKGLRNVRIALRSQLTSEG